MSARSPVRMGVLGCSGIAERRMLPSMADQPLVRVTAIASRAPARAAQLARTFGGDPVTGYEQLLARPDVDAVYLSGPTESHAEWTLRALDAGKHVLCEKPFATTLADARAAVASAREHGLLVMEDFMFLYHSQHAAVRRLLADGAIGELRVLTAEFGIPALPDGRPAAKLSEVAAHPIRAAQLFLGREIRVHGAHSGGALLSGPGGVTAQLSYGIDRGYLGGYRLWGSAGRLTLDRAFSTPDDHVPVLRIDRQDATEEIRLPPDRQFVNAAGCFARAVQTGQGFDGHAGDILRNAALVDALDSSAVARPTVPAAQDGPDRTRRAVEA